MSPAAQAAIDRAMIERSSRVKWSGIPRVARMACPLALAAAALIGSALPARAEMLNEAAWRTGAQWLSLRAGYAKMEARNAPSGNFGWGFGYSQMVSRRLSLGMNLQQDLLGKFDGSALIDLPLGFEALWHFRWNTGVRPYVGGGLGSVYRLTYRTGADHGSFQPMYFGSIGMNAPIDKAHVLGLDVRLAGVSSDRIAADPVFGAEKPRAAHWSVKLNYALTY
jgi:hypothetical protein